MASSCLCGRAMILLRNMPFMYVFAGSRHYSQCKTNAMADCQLGFLCRVHRRIRGQSIRAIRLLPAPGARGLPDDAGISPALRRSQHDLPLRARRLRYRSSQQRRLLQFQGAQFARHHERGARRHGDVAHLHHDRRHDHQAQLSALLPPAWVELPQLQYRLVGCRHLHGGRDCRPARHHDAQVHVWQPRVHL